MEINNEFKEQLKKEQFNEIFGQNNVKKQIKSALIMNRHITIFGQPGIGKTTLAKNIAKILPEITVNDCGFNCLPNEPICPKCKKGSIKTQKKIKGIERFIRVQGSPDLTVEDLIGDIDPIKALEFGPTSEEAFTPGKIFKANKGILFFDEINRCPEKLQNALLQVLEERKATISNYQIDFDADFILIATMNPIDINTEKLSDVLLDRFDVIYMRYPENLEIEKKIITTKGKNFIEVPEKIKDLIVGFVRKLRDSDKLEKIPSVRATLGLYERSQSNAFLNNRNKVIFNDVKEAIMSVISHRIRLKPSVKYLKDISSFVEEEFEKYCDDNSFSSEADFDSKGGDP
jgi:magnesium chelatase subunit I